MASSTVLLAEDDPRHASLISIAFERALPGVRISLVSDGSEAVKYLRGQQPYAERRLFPFPNLVLLNQAMPAMTGFQVLRWIRGQLQLEGLPVVVLAASHRDDDSKLAYELGANSYVLKPHSAELFTEAMVQTAARWLGPRKWLKWGQELELEEQREAA